MEFSVSVVIPVFNGARIIEKQYAQQYSNRKSTEVMIINDGSTDATQSILEQLEQEYEPLADSRLVSFVQYAHAKLPTATLAV